jgi:hypothetical protein
MEIVPFLHAHVDLVSLYLSKCALDGYLESGDEDKRRVLRDALDRKNVIPP